MDAPAAVQKLDPRSVTSRILECAKCFEPVATSAWSGRVQLRCGYCSFEDEREIVLEEARVDGGGSEPYRDRPRSQATKKLTADLGVVLPGMEVDTIDQAKLRASFARRPLLDEDLPSVEWGRVWMGAWYAVRLAVRGDHLRARMILETTLEATKTPAYRALLLARLAQHAAALKATKLARKWLRACTDVGVAEVDSEIRVARALVAFAKGDDDRALELTGGRVAGSGFSGGAPARLACAVQIAARERGGDRAGADGIAADLYRMKVALAVVTDMTAYGLPIDAFARVARRTRARTALVAAAFDGGVFLAAPALGVELGAALAAAALFAALGLAVSWWTFPWLGVTSRQRATRAAMRVVLPIGWTMAAIVWLHGHARQKAPPAAVPTPEQSAPVGASPPDRASAPPEVLERELLLVDGGLLYVPAEPAAGDPAPSGDGGGE